MLDLLDTSSAGLSEGEAGRRFERHGPNVLELASPISAWRILADQLKSLVVLLLFAAAGIALAIGDVAEATAIGAVLVINTSLGFWTEWRARMAMDALRRLQVQEAVVVRDGAVRTIDAWELVPGDIVVLEAGMSVPADARLIAATELRVNEAPLTGESMPVAKSIEAVADEDGRPTPLAERRSMVYKGTLVAAGSGRAVVAATGAGTEIGHLSKLVEETEAVETPLERRLEALGRRLVWLTLAVAAVVTGLGVARGEDIWLMLETGIALAIAAVPEGLPVVATIALAVGVRRMARRQALVRRLPAVETLGSATLICTDKTGTLTAGAMTVTAMVVAGQEIGVTGVGYEPRGDLLRDGGPIDGGDTPGLELALRIGALANRAALRRVEEGWRAEGDPTEAALLVLAEKGGVQPGRTREAYPELAEVPFASERQFMATFHRTPEGKTVAYVKGGPRRIVELSGQQVTAEGVAPVAAGEREAILAHNRELAGHGLRVLALACRELGSDEEPDEAALHDLTFVGLVGIQDPPAEGVEETIQTFHRAGVRTVMITGDQAVTAEAVARELGLMREGDGTLHGRDLADLSDGELVERVPRIAAFSRVTPEDKLRIVTAYQAGGAIVGMLGDGVNDAAALKRADIGVAMGRRGTDVAKETADLVLQDDRFQTIGKAVEDGRVIFDNIRKFIFYLFSCNVSEVLTLLIAGLARTPLPLLPLQILWLNLITDVFPALALAVEPPEPDVMDRPPRDPQSAILSRAFVATVGTYSALITASTLGVFLWGLYGWKVEVEHSVTLAFMTLALAQLFHVVNARSPDRILFTRRMFDNPWTAAALAVTILLQVAAVYLPGLSDVLGTYPLGVGDWALVLGASLTPLLIGQLLKPLSISRH
ncbi:MAG: HAD-IC family P-type ATPase [Gemmatimonadetes bacterium]|nr:HAD-IC family P-type ATPase [Gemmatimonadota bacterium]NIT65590.1 HAD-IC family P-type ATPase [Gemmatimonadota bacterium]NIU52560.1 HAD-IC family P-type ATPase [Gemmatimonadota bacterium]NIW74061.1 HAD-IC family P-type ATPase [Gemmatimonadota bacterium]NIY34168.1 HAD-IC family P-type ATPase [Gemmatimonadota bacterium]